MPTMTAKYVGACKACGGKIRVGQQIDYTRDSGARHVACAKGAGKSASKGDGASTSTSTPAPGPIALHGGSGYGCTGWRVGDVILSGEERRRSGGPDGLVIVTASKRYIREDGLSFGVGDEQGYVYSATARPATSEELRPAIDAAHEQALHDERATELKRVMTIIEAGARLTEEEATTLRGTDTVCLVAGTHGGRRTVIIEATTLALIDGGYYDDYRSSGWRVPRTAELEGRVRALNVQC